MTSRFLVAALSGALLSASASAAPAAPTPPATGTSALVTKSGALPAPPAGKGQVVFFRPGSMIGMALGCTVREGEAEIARLGSGKYYVVTTEPGRHEYYSKGEGMDKLALEIEPDETYFIKCNFGMGVMSGRANLSLSDRDAFGKKAKRLKMWAGPKGDDEPKS